MTKLDGSTQWNYTYNADGLRTQRTGFVTDPTTGVTTNRTYNYTYTGDKLTHMTVDGHTMYFTYDASGTPLNLVYDGYKFYYITNLQGDVISIVNGNGTAFVRYTYDAWGKIIKVDGSATNLRYYNPLRYRGYVYDPETELYYLQSRYYNPEMGRFINADEFTSTGQGVLGNNMFSYCGNNPVIRIDSGGYYWETVFDVISLVVSIVDVVKHPDEPMAWVGLVADVASLVIPVVACGGAIVKVATKADDVVDAVKTVDKIDDAVDTAKTGWHVGDDIASLTKAGNEPSWSTVRQRYWKNEAYTNPDAYSFNDLYRMKKGLAPIGDDGFSMELHQPFGRKDGYFYIIEPLTRTEHRWLHYGGN